jgi:glyoxylase-like metal-dependent hydrolase (beta-lactamase superfamily II)
MERLYRILVPLPNNPLKELNSYVIRGEDRDLIIDTGFNRSACFDAMHQGLRALGIDLHQTDFMLTHGHADHTGLVSRLATDTSRVFFSKLDASMFDADDRRQLLADIARANGFPADELHRALATHPGFRYRPEAKPVFTIIDDGDVIECGGYHLRCIATPGHTQGHVCLYDAERRIFFSGDHVLHDITPHIESWVTANALADYLASLDKVYDLAVDLVLPGHRRFFGNLRGRIDELKAHHRERADEVVTVLGSESMTAYDVAKRMRWDIDCETWQEFPVAQKWFATGETIAHLRLLESEGRVRRSRAQGSVSFRAVACMGERG